MPKSTFIVEEETSLPGHKPMKDHVILLFCANTSGDPKIKPLLVYHSENPQAFKKHKQYLVDNNLPLKAMLLMDNAPAHPPGHEEELLEDFNFIKVMFLLPNTTPLLQPMDEQEPAPESTVLEEEIVSLGRTMGLEVNEEDVCELVEGHDRELTTEDLVELQKQAMEEQISFEEEETSKEQISSRELKETCQMWVNLQTFVQQHHPNKALARRLVNSFGTDIISPFQGMLKRHQRQQTIERFLQKQPRHEEVPCVSAAQLPSSSSSKKC
ncbi:tigger transposable element-derived 1-like [Pelobates cultripes]|uniref:Tigger transposable element-derived 1-like n=1 Tax=Pelobates cultripes TaxID=61616 RepID=A0AAD1RHT7_PELCU|nr:tigger transposable element-derived 1-like [Pelobates cultripes]